MNERAAQVIANSHLRIADMTLWYFIRNHDGLTCGADGKPCDLCVHGRLLGRGETPPIPVETERARVIRSYPEMTK